MNYPLNEFWVNKCNNKNLKQHIREKELLSSLMNAIIRDLEIEYKKIPKLEMHDGTIVGIIKAIDVVKRVKP